MKYAKKLTGFLLALVMMLAMTTLVFADGDNSITVTGAQAGETYNIYKMLDLSVNDEKTAYTYTVNKDWTAFFTGDGAGAAYVTIDTQGYVTWKDGKDTAADMEAFGKAAAAYATANNIKAAANEIKPAEDGEIKFEGLDSGYYLITSTNGTLAMVDTTPTNPDATVEEKNPDSTLDKKVQEDSNESWGKENSAQIGDTVNFQVTIVVKKGAKNYVMHDKMEDGLTFDVDSVAIEGLTKGTDYTVVATTPEQKIADGCTFEIRFAQDYLDSIEKDTNLTIKYNAVLNENAEVASSEKNDAQLTWGDNSETQWSRTETKTYQFSVLKYDAKEKDKEIDERNPLAGATFQLKDVDGNVVKLIKISNTEYRVANRDEEGAVDSFTTVEAGKIVIKGVDLDKYTLVEITAPAGYNALKEPVEVTVNADNNLVVEVPNSTGTELPSTGGIGTTIFYVIGGLLVLGAAVVLVTRKRMSNKD